MKNEEKNTPSSVISSPSEPAVPYRVLSNLPRSVVLSPVVPYGAVHLRRPVPCSATPQTGRERHVNDRTLACLSGGPDPSRVVGLWGGTERLRRPQNTRSETVDTQ